MPKVVDHYRRRLEIVEATWRVIEKMGLQKMRLSDVAKEAGFTTGVLPTYFQNRQDLIDVVFAEAADRLFDRIKAKNAKVVPSVARIFNAVAEFLPRPDVPESTALAVMCFAVRDDGDGAVSTVYREKSARLLSILLTTLNEAVDAQAIKLAMPASTVIQVLALLIDGMCIRVLSSPTAQTRASCLEVIESTILLMAAESKR